MKKIQSNSRTTSRAKRKKTKLILFGSIGIVLILIAFVSYSIFSPNDNKAGSNKSAYASAKNSKNNDENGVKETSTTVQTIDDDESEGTAPESPEQTGAQTGAKHATSYDRNSQDWQAMLQTISSAVGTDPSNMTVWFLGSDKSNPGGSVGTVSAKTKGSQKYRVYLIWDGSGYKATKVEPAS
ncbi:YrrS family protein [Gottfriedia acidiceleris]|uniref:YrrS family protein n=1 Tax=Gottfriedia acidiceleris TaxID=371036 RepID=UPI003000B0F6